MNHDLRYIAQRMIALLAATMIALGALLLPPATMVSAGTETACFRVLHASPDTPNIDVYVSSKRVAQNLAYTKFAPTKWQIALQSVRVRVYVTPGDPNTPALRDVNVPLQIGKCYVIVIGNFNQQLEIFVLEDPPVPPTGQFTIRLANLAPGSPPLDLTKSDGTPLIGNVPFKSATPSTYTAGIYALQIKQTGTGALLLDLGTHTFRSRERETVYVFAIGGTTPTVRSATAQSAPQFLFVRDR